jgi:hypothetical protein
MRSRTVAAIGIAVVQKEESREIFTCFPLMVTALNCRRRKTVLKGKSRMNGRLFYQVESSPLMY